MDETKIRRFLGVIDKMRHLVIKVSPKLLQVGASNIRGPRKFCQRGSNFDVLFSFSFNG